MNEQAVAERILGIAPPAADRQAHCHGGGLSLAAASRVLKRAGLWRLKDIEPVEPIRRYECEQGEIIHVHINKLGRFSQMAPHHG